MYEIIMLLNECYFLHGMYDVFQHFEKYYSMKLFGVYYF